MIRTIIRRLREKRDREAATAALIARRAVRVSNRKASTVAAYEAKHMILAFANRLLNALVETQARLVGMGVITVPGAEIV